MTNEEYKVKEVQNILDDLEVNNKNTGAIKISGWNKNTKVLNISVTQIEAIRDILSKVY